MYGHPVDKQPNPFVKVKVFQQCQTSAGRQTVHSSRISLNRKEYRSECIRKSKLDSHWTFKTKTAWETTAPVWNEHFEVDDITEDHFPNMYIEITVMHKHRVRTAQPLGQIRIGPGLMLGTNQHWEQMVHHHDGTVVTMTHLLGDI